MEKRRIVKMKVHAGGGWEGHVVFTAINPDQESDSLMASNMREIYAFCKKRDLQMDPNFEELVKRHLSFNSEDGLVVPIDQIDEVSPISSASRYLKQHFSAYY